MWKVAQEAIQTRGQTTVYTEDTNSKCMNSADNSLCTRCGCSKHYRGEMCPASSARCQRCDKRGHYSAQCFSRKASASASQVSLDCAFLDIVGDSSTSC